MEKFLFNMSNEDKIDLVVKATESGIDIEKDLVPALNNVKQMIEGSLLLKNLKYMKLED